MNKPAATVSQTTERLLASYRKHGGVNHEDEVKLPTRGEVVDIVRRIEALCFPGFSTSERLDGNNLEYWTGHQVAELLDATARHAHRDLWFQFCRGPADERDCFPCEEGGARREGRRVAERLLESLPSLREDLLLDVEALLAGDPAARSPDEVILAYPGLHAILTYRVAHLFWQENCRLLARMMSEDVHSRTGIDIHPGAQIGKHFFIDHGTGLVVGESCVIGDHVKLYQGVTLGALSVSRRFADQKRHPTLGDRVTVYAGATILGGETEVGHDSIVGGNVWLVRSVPPFSLVEADPHVRVRPKSAADSYYEI